MTEQLALAYSDQLAEREGWEAYQFRVRNLFAPTDAALEAIDTGMEYWILLDCDAFVRVTSDNGAVYDRSALYLNELTEVFQGILTIKNTGQRNGFVRFLQIIPTSRGKVHAQDRHDY